MGPVVDDSTGREGCILNLFQLREVIRQGVRMWMIVRALAVASIPVPVVGTWYVVMTLILGVLTPASGYWS